ncbi:thiamine phosphate synthase [Asticcacaulis sp. EMRT-3]|uniref:thiamine phosphate synthase n=1 Tax=Asticcacaulis sp. EMRT-3 TaxID=3040349 RepID=UPI0024AFE500|nr:thiamine phosphate synthase [Asticcacaulis sp. EMRT-3]MDI7775804.1 thiamine phosphate synthase [Asticcacaulis sp. EMRT-3]
MTYATRFQYLYDKARLLAHSGPAIKPGALPPLFFFTDPKRTPHPEDIASLLPMGCGIVYRHFGETHALQRARLLRRIADDRGLTLLIGEDAALALEVGADGIHLAERSRARAESLKLAAPELILTIACHEADNLQDLPERDVLSAVFISPVFASHSPSAQGKAALGLKGLRAFTEATSLPVYGLGGINCDTITQLHNSGLAGVACIDAFTA